MATTEPPDPEVLTVQKAAERLRIGRNAAYALAREWLATGGRSGLPCISLGRTIRAFHEPSSSSGFVATTSDNPELAGGLRWLR